MPWNLAKIATARAITSERTKIIIQTSAFTDVHFTNAFIVPNEILPNIIHKTATLGESTGNFDTETYEVRSGPSLANSATDSSPLPRPLEDITSIPIFFLIHLIHLDNLYHHCCLGHANVLVHRGLVPLLI